MKRTGFFVASVCLSWACLPGTISNVPPQAGTGGGIASSTGGGVATAGGGSGQTGGGSAAGGGEGGGVNIDPIDPVLDPGTCGLAQPAFCEKFDSPKPGGKGGDLDEKVWAFSRWAHDVGDLWVRSPASTYGSEYLWPSTFCGQPFSGIMPNDDVAICAGKGVDGILSNQLNEVFDDEGDFAFHSMRVRQPFDFADRTGTLVWDVDAKINPLNTGHGWWIEVWITADPAPMPYHEAPCVTSLARKSIGFAFRFGGGCPKNVDHWQSALEEVHVTEDYKFLHAYGDNGPISQKCFNVADGHLNHFELRINKDTAELWASDYDDPASFKRRSVINNLDLTFTRGYVAFQHAQYNASKDGHVTRSQTFRWDNIGFDGPTYPTPRSYEVADNTEQKGAGTRLGYYLDDAKTKTFTLHGVDLTDALAASFNFDVMQKQGASIEYAFNGKSPHTFTVPIRSGSNPDTNLRGFTLPVDLKELVAGDNTLTVRAINPTFVEGIGNMDLTIEVPK